VGLQEVVGQIDEAEPGPEPGERPADEEGDQEG
jgi:hypothetical protein